MDLLKARKVGSHMVYAIHFGWFGFSYRSFEVDYRNWVTTDFELNAGVVRITGWIP